MNVEGIPLRPGRRDAFWGIVVFCIIVGARCPSPGSTGQALDRTRSQSAPTGAGSRPPARCPSRDSRASCRGGNWAGSCGHAPAAASWSAGTDGGCRCMCASRGVRPPFLRLQGAQAVATFSQVVRPPWARGMTWSKVSSRGSPQYWQEKRSRRNRLNRVKAGYSRRPHILPQRDHRGQAASSKLGLCTSRSYWATMSTRSRNTALTAVCHGHRLERIIAERRVIRVEHQRRAAVGMPEKIGMVQGSTSSRFLERTSRNAAPEACRTQNEGEIGRPAVFSCRATLWLHSVTPS